MHLYLKRVLPILVVLANAYWTKVFDFLLIGHIHTHICTHIYARKLYFVLFKKKFCRKWKIKECDDEETGKEFFNIRKMFWLQPSIIDS